jgi:cysteine desulfuration protein SufE
MTLDTIRSDFELLDDWEDRYRYVIELGRSLPPFPDAARTETNKVRGCASQVWLLTHREIADGTVRLTFEGDSDAHIVKGLVAILLATYSGKTPAEIRNIDAEAVLGDLGLIEHLTPQRSNGFRSMVQRIKAEADQTPAT